MSNNIKCPHCDSEEIDGLGWSSFFKAMYYICKKCAKPFTYKEAQEKKQ